MARRVTKKTHYLWKVRAIDLLGSGPGTTYIHLREQGQRPAYAMKVARQQLADLGPGPHQDSNKYRRMRETAQL